jgi:methylenetetrahydrofolate reductase (NADPH)
MQAPKVSFEFFPPATEKMEETLWHSVERLAPLNPSFVSVTYGAGGSTRERTHATVKRLRDETALEPAAHLTCVGATRHEVNAVIQSYWDSGIRHIVALRGDPPEGAGGYTPHPDGYANAAELTAGIKKIADIFISVAAYPETHPDSASRAADIDMLKQKIDAGAEQAITQFFFEPDYFFRYRDAVAAAGISIPIIPGIIPVNNFTRIKSFAAMCGATIPDWMVKRFEGLEEDPDTRKLVAATIAAEFCHKLAAGGVDQFHFYTLNQADLTYAICHLLGLRSGAAKIKD